MELADVLDSKSSGMISRVGSNPTAGTFNAIVAKKLFCDK